MIQMLALKVAGLLPWKKMAKTFLTEMLTSQKTKDQVFKDLREGAQDTETEYDDAAVDATDKLWGDLVASVIKVIEGL
jgi:hypothetical protein